MQGAALILHNHRHYAKHSANFIVFVDPSSPDTLSMAAKAIVARGAACVMSWSVADFRVPAYEPSDWQTIKDIVGLQRAIKLLYFNDSVAPSWVTSLPMSLKRYFHEDAELDEDSVMEDTLLHMDVCALQLLSITAELGRNIDDVKLYRDGINLDTAQATFRHAFRVPNYTYGFNTAEQQEYDKAAAHPFGEERRSAIHAVCKEYVRRTVGELGIEDASAVFTPFSSLIQANLMAPNTSELIVCGPLTEANQFVRLVGAREIFVQGGSLNPKGTLLGHTSNFQADPAAASALTIYAAVRRIALSFVGTGVIKNSVWEIRDAEMRQVFQWSEILQTFYRRYQQDLRVKGDYHLFGLATLAVSTNPQLQQALLMSTVRTSFTQDEDGTPILGFEVQQEPTVVGLYNCGTADKMMATRSTLLEMMRI
ncbi:hypothetical protein F4604DRAFT_1676372 [Suillus subluteus]|nr:hypothetical protein F4604DRAFT_1676372 [Suillus subluteus]